MRSVRNTAHRISDLEAKIGINSATRRVYSVIGGPKGDSAAEFIRGCGYELNDNDIIIHLVPMAPSGDGPTFVEYPWDWVGRAPAHVVVPDKCLVDGERSD